MVKVSKKKSKTSSKKGKKKKSVSKLDVKVKTERKLSPNNARKKGLDFEREVANALKHIFPNAERQLEAQISDCKGIDLRGTNPFKIQCKRNRLYAPISKIEEVVIGSDSDIPVLITRADHMRAVAVLYFEDFVDLLEKLMDRAPGEEDTVPENNVNDDSILSEEAIVEEKTIESMVDDLV